MESGEITTTWGVLGAFILGPSTAVYLAQVGSKNVERKACRTLNGTKFTTWSSQEWRVFMAFRCARVGFFRPGTLLKTHQSLLISHFSVHIVVFLLMQLLIRPKHPNLTPLVLTSPDHTLQYFQDSCRGSSAIGCTYRGFLVGKPGSRSQPWWLSS